MTDQEAHEEKLRWLQYQIAVEAEKQRIEYELTKATQERYLTVDDLVPKIQEAIKQGDTVSVSLPRSRTPNADSFWITWTDGKKYFADDYSVMLMKLAAAGATLHHYDAVIE